MAIEKHEKPISANREISCRSLFERDGFPDDAFYIRKELGDRKIIVYGAGESFHYFKEIVMRKYGYMPSVVLDQKFADSATFEGIPARGALSYKPTAQEKREGIVVVCQGKQSYVGEVLRLLQSMGFRRVISLLDIYEIHNPFGLPQALEENGFAFFLDGIERIESCPGILADDLRREVFVKCLKTHMHMSVKPCLT
ncbi:MAG: hypothetical protein P4L43_19310 [Syntrophobacteraceae bacterium]|nr:hypothetical protein [Syntrophobacteraceae bacterium]